MTITEQIRRKLKTVDEELQCARAGVGLHEKFVGIYIDRARRILPELARVELAEVEYTANVCAERALQLDEVLKIAVKALEKVADQNDAAYPKQLAQDAIEQIKKLSDSKSEKESST